MLETSNPKSSIPVGACSFGETENFEKSRSFPIFAGLFQEEKKFEEFLNFELFLHLLGYHSRSLCIASGFTSVS